MTLAEIAESIRIVVGANRSGMMPHPGVTQELVDAAELLTAHQVRLQTLLGKNGGPTDGDDGVEYVLVRREDFEAIERFMK
jgi:hypothetical protein